MFKILDLENLAKWVLKINAIRQLDLAELIQFSRCALAFLLPVSVL